MTETRHDTLWRRVEAHLDARTDPFQDVALARELRAVPEAERATRRVLARLGALRSASEASEASAPARRAASRRARAAALVACAAAGVAAFALLRGSEDARRRAPLTTPPELGVIYSAHVAVERTVPPPPRAALVVHESRHVIGWTLEGNRR
jgi:hypothetical protein